MAKPPVTKPLSLYQVHVEQWRDCQRCSLHKTRTNIVLARGKVPCDIVLVGEAPGQGEDTIGSPFVGPAGQLLDEIIDKSIGSFPKPLRYALTNLLACIPLDPDNGDKLAEPEHESIQECRPRVEDFLRICQPKLVISVGKLANTYLGQHKRDKYSIKLPEGVEEITIVHPSAIIRANIAQRGFMIHKAIVTITSGVSKVYGISDV